MTKIQTRQYQRKFPSTIRKTLHRRRVEPPALGDSTMQCGGVSMQLRLVWWIPPKSDGIHPTFYRNDGKHCGFGWFGGYHQKAVGSTLRFIVMMESIAASVGSVDTTKKRWDPPYDIFDCSLRFCNRRRVEPPALGDSTMLRLRLPWWIPPKSGGIHLTSMHLPLPHIRQQATQFIFHHDITFTSVSF